LTKAFGEFFSNHRHLRRRLNPQTDTSAGQSDDRNGDIVTQQYSLPNLPAQDKHCSLAQSRRSVRTDSGRMRL
jgi:hypothetical protein